MARNVYYSLSPEALLPWTVTLHAALANAAYGIPAATRTALGTAMGALATANDAYESTHAAAKAATADRNAKQQALVDQISSIAKTLYNTAAVTDPMLATAGLAIHDTSPSPQAPTQPLNLTATPSWNGSVALKWARNGNPTNTTFIIEGSATGSRWDVVFTTTKARATVNGFAPGTTYRFRVRASKNDFTTLPSNETIIYPSGEEDVQLQIAA